MTERTTCVLPWIGVCINNPGKVTPCCRFNGAGMAHVTIGGTGKNLSEYHMRMPQRHFILGEYPEHCIKCEVEDKSGVRSMRQNFNEIYDDVDTRKINYQSPRYLEMSFGNICNLACRMCNSNDSTRWAGVERHIINETGYGRNEKIWPEWRLDIDAIDVDLSEVDRLKFMGGEPLLHPNHEEFLDKLVVENNYSGRVTARYHTNATVKPNDRVLEIWDQLGSVEIAFSIDGVEDMNDYMRPPSVWNEVQQTVQWYKDLGMKNLSLHVHSVYSMINVFDIHNMHEFVKDHKIRIWNKDIVRDPAYLCISNAPYDYKHRAKIYMQGLGTGTRILEDACDQVQQPDRWQEFKRVTPAMDRYWNTNLKYVNEQLWSMVN